MKLLIRFFAISFILTLLVSGGLWMFSTVSGLFGWGRSAVNEENSLKQETAAIDLAQGFTQDTDNDGLSDAKEQIFGTNAESFDSDGDTFRDGNEVENGYDPTIAGAVRITDNPKFKENLTIQFFEWGREQLGEKDIFLSEEKVERFFQAKGLAQLRLPEIRDEELAISGAGPEAFAQYLVALSAVSLPPESGSFIAVAEGIIRTKDTSFVDRILMGLALTEQGLLSVETPAEATSLHKGYVSMLRALKGLFADLYTVERDPVKLMRNLRWGKDLITYTVELEKQRSALTAQLGIQPPEQQESAP